MASTQVSGATTNGEIPVTTVQESVPIITNAMSPKIAPVNGAKAPVQEGPSPDACSPAKNGTASVNKAPKPSKVSGEQVSAVKAAKRQPKLLPKQISKATANKKLGQAASATPLQASTQKKRARDGDATLENSPLKRVKGTATNNVPRPARRQPDFQGGPNIVFTGGETSDTDDMM